MLPQDSHDLNLENIRAEMKPSDYFVAFSGLAKSYCVGLVDIITSTPITARLDSVKTTRFYEIFFKRNITHSQQIWWFYN